MVVIDLEFLKTLPLEEIKSGYSEMIKHSLITGIAYWESIKLTNINLISLGNSYIIRY